MSIDRRVREGFERSSPAIEPNDREALERVRARARRSTMARRATTAMIVGLIVGAAVVTGPAALNVLREWGRPEPAQEPTPSPPVPDEAPIAGTFTTMLSDEDPAAQDNQMVGGWTVTFRSDGVLEVSPPESFEESRSGYSFDVSGNQFRTDLFRTGLCNDTLPGRYRWHRSGDRLTFDVVDEMCPAREALFAGGPWHLAESQT